MTFSRLLLVPAGLVLISLTLAAAPAVTSAQETPVLESPALEATEAAASDLDPNVASIDPLSARRGRLRNERPGIFKALAIGERDQPAPTGWYPFVIARGDDREALQATPIELRPFRPLHFYGNAIRRQLYGLR